MAGIGKELPKSLIPQMGLDLVRLYLRPVMGHISEETTEQYLSWVADRLWVASYRYDWSAALESEG